MPSLFPKGFPDPAVWERPPFDTRPWRNVRIYDTYRQSPDLGPMVFEAFSTAFEMAGDPNFKSIRISVEAQKQKEGWLTQLCIADWDNTWFRDWATAFSKYPAARVPYESDKFAAHHPAQMVDLPGGPAEIDEALVETIRELNAQGILTSECCQRGSWGQSSGGWIALQPGYAFPTDLAAAWKAADIRVFTDGLGRQAVHASVMFGNEAAAAVPFRRSLDDWMQGTLDMTGEAYRITDLRHSRPMSRPPLDVPLSPGLRPPAAPGPTLSR